MFNLLKKREEVLPPPVDEFLLKGAAILEAELDQQSLYAMNLAENYSLANIDLLSCQMVANRNLPQEIRKNIEIYRQNVRKVIVATTHFIETKQLKGVEQTIKAFSRFDQERIETLLTSQQSMNFSFRTLQVALDLFELVNQNLLDQLKNPRQQEDRFEKSNLHLKNAVLVYELTDFIIELIENFSLRGFEEIKAIRTEVFATLDRTRGEDLKLKQSLNQTTSELRKSILTDIANREAAREIIKQRWKSFDEKVIQMEQGVDSALDAARTLKIIRDNAKNQLDLLQLIATIQLLEKSFELSSGLALMKKISLAPLTPKDACYLLGIDLP